MESVTKEATTLRSCLKKANVCNINGKILGRDGKPIQPYRNVKLGTDKEVSITSDEPTVGTQLNKGSVDDSQPKGWWEDNEVRSNPKVNFRAMVNHEKIENSDFVLPITAIHAMKHKFENSLVGFFVDKKVAFPLVKNYVTNTWAKFGFEKVMSDDDGVFYFKFASLKGLEQVLEQGPWLIRNIPLMLTKWSPNMSLSKDKVTKVPVWVKLHKVPVVAYSEDGLSLIATQIGNPIMLDAFTSAMCVDAWGRIGYARALIEVSANKELKKEVTMAVPNIDDEVVSHTLEKIKVEYEWKPPHCLECHVFGHAADQCPKHVHEKPKPTVETSDDGFTTVVNKRSRGKGVANPQRTNKGSFSGVRVNNPNQNFVYQPVKKAQKPSEKEGNNEENNNGVKLKNLFEKLNEITSVVDPSGDDGEAATIGDTNKKDNTDMDDSDSEVEEVFSEENPNKPSLKGASTSSDYVSNV
ncbi:trichome birefringence-like protein 3 [Tanacetum coccineum]